jgi:hypothetical protein
MACVRRTVALVVGLAAMTAPAPAGAAVTIGSDLSGPSDFTLGCITCTALQLSHPSRQIQSPIDGVAVRYRIKKEAVDWNQVRLRVLRPAGGGAFDAVGTSPPTPTSALPDGVLEFPAQIPVQVGDHIGIDATGSVEGTQVTGSSVGVFFPPLADDAPPASPFDTHEFELFLNADIEPDCDSDGFGDETQDPMPACPRSVTLAANKNKVKEGRRVTLTGQVNTIVRQGPCESGQPVLLQRKRPNKTTFNTVEELQTDPAGSFSVRKKVKKTFEYRAQVAETATCAGGLSNTEKVKVRKKN